MLLQNLIAVVTAALKSVEATNLPTTARPLKAQAFKSTLPTASLMPLRRDVMIEAPGMLCECISMCLMYLVGMTYGGDLAGNCLDAGSKLGVEIDGGDILSSDVEAVADELVVVCAFLRWVSDQFMRKAGHVLTVPGTRFLTPPTMFPRTSRFSTSSGVWLFSSEAGMIESKKEVMSSC